MLRFRPAERAVQERKGDEVDWCRDHGDSSGQAASVTWEIAALAAALALWRDYGWRVSVPLAAAGWVLSKGHFPPDGIIAGFVLGIAVWQYLILGRRVGDTEH